jgi:dipeptidyl aminopeptidase/acylaminoacyl peptidase
MQKTFLATVVVVLALVVAVPARQSAQPSAQSARRFGFDDFSRVKRVADPQFSPDSRTIVVIVSTPNLDENRHMAALHKVEIASGRMTQLVSGDKYIGVSFPRWAPSGSHVAFLATVPTNGTPRAQIFSVPAAGGDPKQLTSAPSGVQQFAWSPDSRNIGFATADEPEKKPGYQRWNDSFEVLPGDHLYTTATLPPTHVWMVPAAGGTSQRLTSGSWTLPVARPPGAPSSYITWTPDSSAIVFSRGALLAVNVSDGSIRALGTGGNHPVYSASGDKLVFSSGAVAAAPALTGPALTAAEIATSGRGADAGGGNRGGGNRGAGAGGNRGGGAGGRGDGTLTQAIDRGIARALWMPDGQSIIVGGNDSERVSLWQVPLDGSPAKKLDTDGTSPNSSFFVDMAIAKDGGMAFAGTSPTRPAELYYKASPTAPTRRLTSVNDEIAGLPLGRSEVVTYTNDKFEQNGILTFPPDFDPSKKYPMVLLIHGGPRAASMMTFSPSAQLMAAKGWLVFQPNYRGSDNLGREFQGAINNDAGAGPGRDVMAGVESIKKRGYVDDRKLGVSGWSYGGYMTTWMLGNYPDVWRVGVAGAAVTDQVDQRNLGDGASPAAGQPFINPQAMESARAQSPITYAAKIKAPTLILSNTEDYRVPMTQSFKLFHILLANGVTTKFFAYPIYGHNAQDPVRQRDVQERWIGWLETYLNESPAGAGRGGGR